VAENSPALLVFVFTTSLLVGFSGAMMPGPLLMVTVSETARRGFLMAPLLVLGHGIAEAGVVVGLTIGLGEFLKQGPVAATIGLLGGLFLFWMGYGIIRSAWLRQVSLHTQGGGPARGGPVLAGALTSLANPYWVLWWATVGASYVAWSLRAGMPGLISFYGGHVLSDLSWYSLMGFAVVSGRRVLGDDLYRALLIICGAFLIVLAGYFIWSAVGFWQG